MSRPARRWIDKSLPSSVYHVFPHACNLINNEQEILSLVTEKAGLGPFAIVVDLPIKTEWGENGFWGWIDSGSLVSIEEDALSVGDLHVQITDARPWDPKLKAKDPPKIRASLSRHLASIITILEENSISDSFANIVENLLAPTAAFDGSQVTEKGDRFLSAVIKPAISLCHGLRRVDLASSLQAARKLTGVGAGLTPAGDDFILGAFLGYHLLEAQGPTIDFLEEIVIGLEGRTNALSIAYLRAAAHGEASIAWHELVSSIERNSSGQLAKVCKRILKTGHSSGADSLIGFVTLLSWLLLE